MQRRPLASSLMILVLIAGSGCAHAPSAPDARPTTADLQPLQPRGPGAVFPTADAAALDGLLLAYLQARADAPARARLARGGTVFPVEGGFSYGPLVQADPGQPSKVPLVLQPRDVAHFHTYPRSSAKANRLNETHSPNDRQNVDRRDPLQRPSYVLTPSLRVQRYDTASGERLVARIDTAAQGVLLARAER